MLIKYISWMVYGIFCFATGTYMIRHSERKEKLKQEESESGNVDNSNSLDNYKDFFISYLLAPLVIIIGLLLFL